MLARCYAELASQLVDDGYLQLDDLKDHWGNFYHSNLLGKQMYASYWLILNSAGPDGRWGTADDISNVGAAEMEFANMDAVGGIMQRGAERGRFVGIDGAAMQKGAERGRFAGIAGAAFNVVNATCALPHR